MAGLKTFSSESRTIFVKKQQPHPLPPPSPLARKAAGGLSTAAEKRREKSYRFLDLLSLCRPKEGVRERRNKCAPSSWAPPTKNAPPSPPGKDDERGALFCKKKQVPFFFLPSAFAAERMHSSVLRAVASVAFQQLVRVYCII